MTTIELQAEIKRLIRAMGWKQARAAERICYEQDSSATEKEALQFVESFKKQLSRATTPPERLKRYLKILCALEEARKLEIVMPVYVPGRDLDKSLQKHLQAISRDLDREIRIRKRMKP